MYAVECDLFCRTTSANQWGRWVVVSIHVGGRPECMTTGGGRFRFKKIDGGYTFERWEPRGRRE
jgi:hypothetical protein